WVQANSAADAVFKAFSGQFYGGYDSSVFTFGTSGAFQYNPDLTVDGEYVGPAIVVNDRFAQSGHGTGDYGQVYLPISVVGDQIWTTASTADQSQAQSGYTVVGSFRDADVGSAIGDYT